MKVTVRNLLGVEMADLPLGAISLVAGLNGAGKTSLLDAIGIGVTGAFAARGIRTKKDAGQLLHNAAPAGSVTLEWSDGAQRVDYPETELRTKGSPRHLGTPLGIGSARWMSLDPKMRAREMAERLKLEPTFEDLKAFLAKKEEPRVHEDTVTAVWKLVQDQGWDGAEKKAKDKATKARGAWESIANQAFGAKKAAEWVPVILRDAQIFTQDAADAAVATAKKAAEELIVAGALAGEEVKRIRTAAQDLGPAQARETTARAALSMADKAAEKLAEDLAKIPVIEEAHHTYPCPHCEKPVLLKSKPGGGVLSLDKPPAPVAADVLKQNRVERQAIEQALGKEREKVEKAQRETQAAVAAVRAAEAATSRLVEIEAMPKADDDAIAEARAAQAEAEAVAREVRDWLKAKDVYTEWILTQPIIEALAPTGVRAVRVAVAITEFNRRLGLISQTAGFAPVTLTEGTDLLLGGRPFGLLSESEQWRCEFAMTLALAAIERPVVVLVDRLDILHPQARPGVFEVLKEVGVPAVVGYTAKDAASLPKLQEHGYGRTYWLENARLSPVA